MTIEHIQCLCEKYITIMNANGYSPIRNSDNWLNHACWLFENTLQISKTDPQREGKINRHLAFGQTLLFCVGIFSVDDLKDHNRDIENVRCISWPCKKGVNKIIEEIGFNREVIKQRAINNMSGMSAKELTEMLVENISDTELIQWAANAEGKFTFIVDVNTLAVVKGVVEVEAASSTEAHKLAREKVESGDVEWVYDGVNECAEVVINSASII